MNKKLVAVAVAGVLAAPLAAQAQTANVTLYGRLNMTYELITGKKAFEGKSQASVIARRSKMPRDIETLDCLLMHVVRRTWYSSRGIGRRESRPRSPDARLANAS